MRVAGPIMSKILSPSLSTFFLPGIPPSAATKSSSSRSIIKRTKEMMNPLL